jgi:hypothetical protein
VTEPAEPAPLPHRQRQHQSARGGDGLGPAPGPAGPPPRPPQGDLRQPQRAAPAVPPEDPRPWRPDPVRAAEEEAPLYQAERARLREQPPPPPTVPEPAEAPPPAQAAPSPDTQQPGPRLTQAGLPRRVPRANLAPGMAAQEPADQPAPPPGRSPDEVRDMLSSYRTGIERGRTVAGGAEPGERSPDAS